MGVGIYKVFNFNDLLLFYSVYICYILGLRRDNNKHITLHILNHNSSILLDNFSSIISKRFYHTSFRLHIVNVLRTFPQVPE